MLTGNHTFKKGQGMNVDWEPYIQGQGMNVDLEPYIQERVGDEC